MVFSDIHKRSMFDINSALEVYTNVWFNWSYTKAVKADGIIINGNLSWAAGTRE